MFSHIFTSVTDFEKSLKFYKAVMLALELEQRFCDVSIPWAGWHSEGKSRPFFVICKPFDGHEHDAGNGQMVAFSGKTRAMVRLVHEVALANGGTNAGDPGLRLRYHPNYYGAYFRDPDGNKICVACHGTE